ncbi:hypothetical protein CYMTET_49947 [Cymbomonas tetramitiformis]|uniref:Uncharacterized protein n=1 Tax=Cymbomonas tetramitiformis TaxID=36881 RepID=A0AAE0BQD7_9CHLO|nr:hypothetical protein CYMTET_49947 [Cymbomonas tetramitiformis]
MKRCGRLYYTFDKEIAALAPQVVNRVWDPVGDITEEEWCEEERARAQLRPGMEMRREVNTWMRTFLEPLFTVVPDKAHAFLALALDPRFKGLGVIVGLIGDRASDVRESPSSQIECERIFSIAGLAVGIRRKRLSPECLDEIVNIYKNYPQDATYDLSLLKGAEEELNPAVEWERLAR